MTITNELGDCFFTLSATSFMMPRFISRRSSRFIPGFLGIPAVIMNTSEFFKSSQLEVPEIETS